MSIVHPRVPLDVQCGILGLLATPDMQRFAMTNRDLYRYYSTGAIHLCALRIMLSNFFDHPDDFRELQARTGVLISGSQALQFLAMRSLGARDLDLYVEHHSAYVVILWLTMNGYRLIRRSRWGELFVDSAFTGREFRSVAMTSAYSLRPGQLLFTFLAIYADRKIDLIVSVDNALSSILDFHSSLVMNFIAADCAVSLFPHATFVQDLSLVFKPETDRINEVLAKYANRGFESSYDVSSSFAFAPGCRWIGHPDVGSEDVGHARNCWVLRMPPVIATARSRLFWWLFPHRLASFWSSEIREDAAYWERNGWEIRICPEDPTTAFMEYVPLQYGDVRAYCVPIDFYEFATHRICAIRHVIPRTERARRMTVWIHDFRSST